MTNYPLREDATDEQRLHLEVVLDPKTAAELLTHAAELLRAVDHENDHASEISRWRQDFEDFRDAR